MPLLSGTHLDQIMIAAKALPRPLRDSFMQQVAALLGGKLDPGDGDVWRACKTAQAAVTRPSGSPLVSFPGWLSGSKPWRS
jgi:hypothetical protein